MFGVLSSVSVPQAGAVYKTYDDLMRELNNRMEKEGYKVVKSRSHRSRVGGADVPGNEIVRCDLVCDRGGRPYKCMATKHKTSTKKTDCPWRAKAVFRKAIQGWILTIHCDQHNHEPGTPEPPTPSEASLEDEDEVPNGPEEDDGPRPDAETSAAMQVAGVSDAVLRLTGDTFQQFKTDYRKMSQPERLSILSQLQLRIAAIYAVQNEEVQRHQRAEAQRKRHSAIEESRRHPEGHAQRGKRRRLQPEQQQPPQEEPELHEHEETPPTQHQMPHQMHHGNATQQSPLLVHQNTEMMFPVPGFDVPDQFAPFTEPSRRVRGHRNSQPNHPSHPSG